MTINFLGSKFSWAVIIVSFLLSGQVIGQDKKDQQNGKGKDDRESFYEATRQKMLGNYDVAALSFKKCIDKDPNDAAALYELAGIYQLQNQFDQAIPLSEKAASIDPGNKWYKMQEVELYQALKEYSKATEVLQQLIHMEPDNMDYYQNLAINQIYDGDYKEALKTYAIIEEKIGINEDISIQKEKLYLLMNKPDLAIAEVERLTKAYPSETRYLEILAQLYMSGQMYDKAFQTYKKIQEIDPENAYIDISLSDYYRKMGDSTKSFEYLKSGFANPNLDIDTKVQILLSYYTLNQIYKDRKEEAFTLAKILIETHPEEPKAWSIYADLLYQDNRFEEARTALRKVNTIDSSKYLVWEQLLFVESQLSDFKAMDDESNRAIALFPQQPLPYLFSGVANFQMKNYKLAADRFQTGVSLVVDNDRLEAQFYAYLGDSYYQLKDNKASDEAYEKTLSIDPDNALVLNNYAYYLSLRDEQLEKAQKMSKRALELDSANASYQDTYGWVLYKLGHFEDAKEWIDKAIHNGEENAVVLEHYGDVLFKLGDKREAVRYWEKALKAGEGSEFLEKKVKEKTLFE